MKQRFFLTELTSLFFSVVAICSPFFCIEVTSAQNVLNGADIDRSDDADRISFDRQIRPLLSDRCYACHGPDANARAAELRLDRQQDAHESAITPGSPGESELWLRISTDDADVRMPPNDSHKKALGKSEQELVRKWIEQGATYESFWAFEPPKMPTVSAAAIPNWNNNPIDQLVWQSLSERDLQPKPEADPRTLIRRLTLDLTGLPPSLQEIRDYLEAIDSIGSEAAWEKQVDRLLNSRAYGEHIGRYWLDLVRYADTNGMHKDFYRNHFAYRDWVIRSFNEDLGYDDFVRDQIAGDLYENPTPDQLTATAFHRLHLIIDVGTALPEESFHKNVIDRVSAFGTAFMGMTVQCAQCHDHKYDPISQKDFYSLYAFFNNIDAEPETVAFPKNGLQPPFISLADSGQAEQLKKFDQQIAESEGILSGLKTKLKEADSPPSDENAVDETNASSENNAALVTAKEELKAELQKGIKTAEQQLKSIRRQRDQYDRLVPYAMVMKERPQPRPTFVMLRGQYDTPGEPVSRATPSFLPTLNIAGDSPTRLDLANWLTSKNHPLTSRVAVNRIWQQLFGVGLVKTSEDFGAQGQPPSHPQVLDYLSVNFMENHWKFKPLIKSIVMSKTYRQSSVATKDEYRADPENRLLARGSRYRIDAEMVRDQILFTSGRLANYDGGPSVKPPQPPGLWEAVTMINERYDADQGEDIVRRSVYTFWKRGMPPPQMTIFNAPTRDACIARRERTNTPSQALLLLNEPEFMKSAKSLALKVLKQPEAQRIGFVWETVTGRVPDEGERKILQKLLDDLQSLYVADSTLTQQAIGRDPVPDGIEAHQLAAWMVTVNSLYNLDITKNRD